LDVSLGELRVQQLQTGLTTLLGFNELVTFDDVHHESSGASAPVPTSAQDRLVGLTCEGCGKCCKSKAGVVAHHRVHDSDSVEFHADISLASVDLLEFARGLQSGIMTPEQVLSLLDIHASRTFPHTWKTISRNHRQLAHRMPVNRKQIRRAKFAATQTLYHQRRKDAASAVLDGSRKDLYKDGFAFADDWVVCAESQVRLKKKLEAATVELGKTDMKINAHTVTYLNIPFTFKGKGVFSHRQHLLKLLDEMMRVPLKLRQRTEITRNYLIPRLTYSLVLGQVHRNTLKRLDNYNSDAAESAYGKALFHPVPSTTQCGQRFRI
ncbi:polyprotein, partial [Clonorchis sinensis]